MNYETPWRKLLSPAFHKAVFLPFLLQRLKPKKETAVGFGLPFENTILAGITMGLMLIGFINYESIFGLSAGILGLCGFVPLLVSSIRNRIESGEKPSLEDFRVSPFLFSVLLGITAGLLLAVGQPSPWLKILGATGGFLVGYFVGILAGFWAQSLGWMSGIIEVLLWPAMMGMVIVSIILAIV